jgi:nitrate reductase beta subunit
MATVKQIEANRKNATRSTGPRTAVGKSKSSRNALRHGLSLPLIMDAAIKADLEELARLLANKDTNSMAAALHAAAAHLDLQRVQKIRRDMLTKMDLATAAAKDLQRLLAIDRYETRARTRRHRASSKIAVEGGD